MGILNRGRESTGIAVRALDNVTLLVWSNTKVKVRALAQLRPNSGGEPVPIPAEVVATSNRALSFARVQVMQDGVIDTVAVATAAEDGTQTAPTQRGQTFVQVVLDHGSVTSLFATLTAGYVFAGSALALGYVEEPGPAGGHGAITRVSKAPTAVNGATGLVLAAVPTGAMWRWLYGGATYFATATAGNRFVILRFRDGSANSFVSTVFTTLAASLESEHIFAPNLTTEGTATAIDDPFSDVDLSVQFPSPDRALPAGYDLFIFDSAAIDVADTAQLEAQVEEWVMPN